MESNSSHSARDLGDFAGVDEADSANFVTKLDEMHALASFQSYKRAAFEALKLAPGASVADIGCGTGDDARRLIGLVQPHGTVTGFDISAAMLAQARARHSGIAGLGFAAVAPDGFDAPDARYDAVRTDRVLIPVPDARATLDEMVRIAKPGARIVVSEPDMPGCWMASDDPALVAQIVGAIAGSCVSPHLARDLVALFKDAGLADVTLTVSPVTVLDPSAVDAILNVSGVVERLVGAGVVTTERAQAFMADVAERGRTGRFASGLSIMTVSGTKP